MSFVLTLKGHADENRFGHESDAEARQDAVANVTCQVDELGGRAATTVNERQAMLARYADAGVTEALMKAGALDEPGGRQLDATVGLRVLRRLTQAARGAARSQLITGRAA